MRSGITRIGMASAIGCIALALVALVAWLIAINPKKILGVIINGTASTIVVKNWRAGVDGAKGSDLFMKHGSMNSFMQDYELGDLSKVIQINARLDFGEGLDERICAAGLFFADKNIGVYGAEGVMILTAGDGAFEIAHMFAVPYNKDNGTNVSFVRGPSRISKGCFATSTTSARRAAKSSTRTTPRRARSTTPGAALWGASHTWDRRADSGSRSRSGSLSEAKGVLRATGDTYVPARRK